MSKQEKNATAPIEAPWSKNEDAHLRRLIEDGLSYNDVSNILDRSPNGVKFRCYKLGIKSIKRATNSVWDDKNIEILTRMNTGGYSSQMIANRIGCTRNAVIGKLHRLGLSMNSKVTRVYLRRRKPDITKTVRKATYWTDARMTELAEYVKQGLNSTQIAEKFNFEKTPHAIRSRILNRLKPKGISLKSRAGNADGKTNRQTRRAKGAHPFFMPKVPFLDRTEKQCGYPLWGPEDKSGEVCGCSKDFGKPYCSHHMTRAYVPGSNKRVKYYSQAVKEDRAKANEYA